MNRLFNLYGIKVHSDSAFLSFIKNSRNEIGAFSSGYLERKVEGLSFSIPADSVSVGLNQVVPFLRTSAYWNGLVSKPSPEAGQSSSLIIRPKIGRDYTRRSLRFFANQADGAFNTMVGNEVSFKPSGVLLRLDSEQTISKSWLPEEKVSGRIQKARFVPAVREKSFSVEARRELQIETR